MNGNLWKFAKEFGFPATLVVVFVFWSYQREQRLSARIERLEALNHEVLTKLVTKNQQVLSENTRMLTEVRQTLDRVREK